MKQLMHMNKMTKETQKGRVPHHVYRMMSSGLKREAKGINRPITEKKTGLPDDDYTNWFNESAW